MEDFNEENDDIERGREETENDELLSVSRRSKLETRSVLMLKRLSSESIIDSEDDDFSVDNSTKTIISRPIEGAVAVDQTVNWAQWGVIMEKLRRWSIPAAISLVVSIFCKFVLGSYVYFGLGLWIWTGIPFAVMTAYRICDALDFLILFGICYVLHSKSWSIRGFVVSFRHFFGVIGFCVVLNNFVFPMMKRIDSDSITDNGNSVLSRILVVVSVVPIWCCFMVVRDVLFLAIRLRITSHSYKHAITDLDFMENVADRLCSTSMDEIIQIRGRLQKTKHFMDRVDTLIKRNIWFPLERYGENGGWIRSATHGVMVTTEREMVIAALIISDNFLNVAGTTSVSFEAWSRFFSSPAEGSRAFQLFFDIECWNNQKFDETDFVKAFVRLFQRRNKLRDKLRKFENTAKLLLNIADIPYFLLFILTVTLLAGLSISVVAVSCSAVVVSMSFAFGPSIERIVSSISFIFGSKPYEVNDLIEMNGLIYRVDTLSLTQTTFRTESGKLCMIHHSILRTISITNLSRSANASATFEFPLAPKTPKEKIEKLRRFVKRTVAQDSLHWRSFIRFRFRRVENSPTNEELLLITVGSALAWRNLDAFRDAEFELRSTIAEKMQQMEIS